MKESYKRKVGEDGLQRWKSCSISKTNQRYRRFQPAFIYPQLVHCISLTTQIVVT